MKLKENRLTAGKVAGKTRSQGALSIWAAPSAIRTPQLVSGSSPLPCGLHEWSWWALPGQLAGVGQDSPS